MKKLTIYYEKKILSLPACLRNMVELANDLAVSAADHSRINDDGC